MQANEQLPAKPAASAAPAAGRHLDGAAKATHDAQESAPIVPTPISGERDESALPAISPSASALWNAAADLGAYMMTAPTVRAELLTSAYLGWTRYWLRALEARTPPGSTRTAG
jgi:hypothetical protein